MITANVETFKEIPSQLQDNWAECFPTAGVTDFEVRGEAFLTLSQFDRINGGDPAVHGELYFSPEGRAQYVEFFETALSDDDATIPAPY